MLCPHSLVFFLLLTMFKILERDFSQVSALYVIFFSFLILKINCSVLTDEQVHSERTTS
jgi:hypothetical protein